MVTHEMNVNAVASLNRGDVRHALWAQFAGTFTFLALGAAVAASLLTALHLNLTFAVVLAGAWGSLAFFATSFLPRRVLRQAPEDVEWTLTPSGVHLKSIVVDRTLPWSEFSSLVLDGRVMILGAGRSNRGPLLPRRAVSPSDLLRVVRWAAEHDVHPRYPHPRLHAGRRPPLPKG